MAFGDTWRNGVPPCLNYLRDRLTTERDLWSGPDTLADFWSSSDAQWESDFRKTTEDECA